MNVVLWVVFCTVLNWLCACFAFAYLDTVTDGRFRETYDNAPGVV